jgi:hypothetical protein
MGDSALQNSNKNNGAGSAESFNGQGAAQDKKIHADQAPDNKKNKFSYNYVLIPAAALAGFYLIYDLIIVGDAKNTAQQNKK